MSAQAVLFDVPGPRARRRQNLAGVVGIVAILALFGGIAWALRAQLTWDRFQPFAETVTWTAYVLPGLLATLEAALISVVLATFFGFLLGLGRLSHIGILRWVCTVWVEFFRSVPVLVMMATANAIYLFNGVFEGDTLPLMGVITGLTLYNSCVIAELLRAGVHGLPRGQREAGLAIGLTRSQTLTSILIPQAVTAMLPSLVSQLVVILKDTALGYWISYPELLNHLGILAANKGNLIAAYLVGALLFILINWGLTRLAQLLEKRMRGRSASRPEKVFGNLAADPDPDDELYTNTHQFESAEEAERRTKRVL